MIGYRKHLATVEENSKSGSDQFVGKIWPFAAVMSLMKPHITSGNIGTSVATSSTNAGPCSTFPDDDFSELQVRSGKHVVITLIFAGLKVLTPGDGFHRGQSSFLKNLDFYVSGCSICHVNNPKKMFLAANAHLRICYPRDLPQNQRFELKCSLCNNIYIQDLSHNFMIFQK